MKKLTLLLAILGLGAGCSALAQTPGQVTQGPGNTAGILWASNFGQWAVPQGNTGQFSWSVPSQCNATASGIPLNPVFKVGTPITIKDQVPANTEIVTPSAVYTSNSSCSITVSPVYQHNTFTLTSATAGLQEAINYAAGLPYEVILTPDWSRLGGTTGMITAATGSAAVSIEDARGACLVAYLWSGSAYVAQPNSCGGGGGGGTVTSFAAPSASWPSWLVPTVTNSTSTPSLGVTASTIPVGAGGTGATTATGANANLGLISSSPAASSVGRTYMDCFGTSRTNGSDAPTTATRYCNQIAAQLGLSSAFTNYGLGASYQADMNAAIFNHISPSSPSTLLTTMEGSVNDAVEGSTGSYEPIYQSLLLGGLTWAATASDSTAAKVTGANYGTLPSGWTVDNTYAGVEGIQTSTPATAAPLVFTYTVTSQIQEPILLYAVINGDAGTFNVVDSGNPTQTDALTTAPGVNANGSYIPLHMLTGTASVTGYAVGGQPSRTNGSYTVTITPTSTTGTIHIYALVTTPATITASTPFTWLFDIYRNRVDQSSGLIQTYNNDIYNVANEARLANLNVGFSSTKNFVFGTTTGASPEYWDGSGTPPYDCNAGVPDVTGAFVHGCLQVQNELVQAFNAPYFTPNTTSPLNEYGPIEISDLTVDQWANFSGTTYFGGNTSLAGYTSIYGPNVLISNYHPYGTVLNVTQPASSGQLALTWQLPGKNQILNGNNIAPVGSPVCANGNPSLSFTPISVNDTLVVSYISIDGNPPTITDNLSNTYTLGVSDSYESAIYYKIGNLAGITSIHTTVAGNYTVCISEYSGVLGVGTTSMNFVGSPYSSTTTQSTNSYTVMASIINALSSTVTATAGTIRAQGQYTAAGFGYFVQDNYSATQSNTISGTLSPSSGIGIVYTTLELESVPDATVKNLTVQGTCTGCGSGTFTALSGDATSTATGGATTVVGIEGHAIAAPSTPAYIHWSGSAWEYLNPSGSGTVTTSGSPVSPNIAAFSGSTAITAATSANIQTAIGAGVYDASGAAAARQAAYTNLTSIGSLANGAGWLHNDGSGVFAYSTPTAAAVGAEPSLGNPGISGYVLSSTTAGVRSWIANGSGGSMTWPTFTGLTKYGGSSNWVTPTYADVTALWTTCTGYLKSDGTCSAFPSVGTWGALNYPTWVSGTPFVKMTAAGTFSLDTNTYITSSGVSGMTTGQIPIAASASTVTSSKALAGTGTGITTGPTTTTFNDCAKFGDTSGTLADAGAACGSGTTWPYAPQAIYLAYNSQIGSPVTTLADTSGNGYNGTFGTGAAHPTPGSYYGYGNPAAIYFDPSPTQDQYISIPNAATCGANTIIFYYQDNLQNPADGNGRQYLFEGAGYVGAGISNSQYGLIGIGGVLPNPSLTEIDPMIGPAAIAWNSSLGWLPYGVHSTGIISPFINPTMGCGGATGYIGYAGWTNNSGFSGQFYGMVTFSQALTAAQVEQATAYGASLIQQNGGPAFTKTPLNFAAAYYGDSIMENHGGNNALGTSRPTYIAQAQPSLAPFTNFGVSGIKLADINSNNPPATALKANTNAGSTVALVAAGVNDIINATCASAAACYAIVQATPPSPALPNVSTVYATVLPAGLLSSGGETIREGLNSLVIAGALAGTFNFTGVDDIANDPIASTQTTPNSWGTPTAAISVTTCSWSSGTATCTWGSAPLSYECYAGAAYLIAGNSYPGYNGTHNLASCSGTTVTYLVASSPGGTGTGGTATYSYNGNWYADGTHPLPTLNQEISTQEAASMMAAKGSLNSCYVIKKQVPWQVLAAANQASPGLTQTVPLLQLFPKWQVCSLAINVTPVFAGTTTLTMSIGDSSGTATTYLAATTLETAGPAVASLAPFVSANGMVNMYFTSTGTNLNTVSAGNVEIDIGVIAATGGGPGTGGGSGLSGMTAGQLPVAATASTVTSSIAYATANTASTIVERDSSNNITATTFTGALSGNATTATSATSATSATNAVNLLGTAGTLNTAAFANAASGLITLEAASGAITSYALQLPVAQPTAGNTYLSCTAANPAVCTWAAGGGGSMTWPSSPGYALWQSGTAWSTPNLTDNGSVNSSENVTAPGLTLTGIATPVAPTGTPSTSGGTVLASTHNRAEIVAVDTAGNVTLGGPVVATDVTTTGSTSSIAWAWTAVTNAASYQIWVCNTSACVPGYYYTSATNSYTQTTPPASGTSGTLPTYATTGTITPGANVRGVGIMSSAVGNVPLALFGYSSGQTADLFDVYQYPGGTRQVYVASNGVLNTAYITNTGSITSGSVVTSSLTSPASSSNLSITGYGGEYFGNVSGTPFISLNAANASMTTVGSNYIQTGLFGLMSHQSSGTTTGQWTGLKLYTTFGSAANDTYNGSSPMIQLLLSPTINVATGSTSGYCEMCSLPVETSVGTGVTNYFIKHAASGGSLTTPNYAVTEGGFESNVGTQSIGTKFTTTGCSISSTTGGATAGKFTLGANSCSAVITMNGATGLTANNGWSCHANDETTAAGNTLLYFSANSATTATLSVPATAGTTDVIDFACTAF